MVLDSVAGAIDPLRLFLEDVSVDVWAYDSDGISVYQNAASRRRWGNLAGRSIDEMASVPEKIRRHWHSVNERAHHGEVVREIADYDIDAPDGTYLVVVAPVLAGRGHGIIGANIDLTEERRANRNAEGLRLMLHEVFALSPLGLLIAEVRGEAIHVLHGNESAATILGTTVEEIERSTHLNRTATSPLVGRELPFLRSARRANVTVEFCEERGEGKERRLVEWRVTPVPAAEGIPERYLCLLRNVTEERQLAAQLLQANRLASMGSLAASVSHDIANPATYLRLNLEQALRLVKEAEARDAGGLARDSATVPAVREVLETALSGADHILTILRSVRDFTRGEAPPGGASDPKRVVESLLTLAGGELREKASLDTDLHATEPVRVSPMRLGQLVLNLATNAVEAAHEAHPKGARIHIGTGTDVAGRVYLDVEDNGKSVVEDVRRRMIEPFFTPKAGDGPSGFGLYVVRQIAEGANADIDVRALETGGTRIRISFPPAPAVTPALRSSP